MTSMNKRKPTYLGSAIVVFFAVFPACGSRPGLDPTEDAGTADAITPMPCGETAALQPGAAWPMYMGCPERRSRSAAVGPATPDKIRYIERDDINWMGINPVIGAGGTVYIGSFYAYFEGNSMFGPEYCIRRLHAFNQDGTEKWVFESLIDFEEDNYYDPGSGNPPTAITLGIDRIYFVISRDCGIGHEIGLPAAVMAIDYEGNEIWSFSVSHDSNPTSITMDQDGNIYFLDKNFLVSLAPDGIERWSTNIAVGSGYQFPLLYAQNRIFGGRINTVFSLNTDGDLLWQMEIGDSLTSAMSLGDNNIIYLTASVDKVDTLYALSTEGEILWSQTIGEDSTTSSLAVGPDGIIVGSIANSVYAFSSDGELLWTYEEESARYRKSPVIDGEGTIYAINNSRLNAIRHDGTLKWEKGGKEIMNINPTSMLAIGADGALYANCGNKLCIIEP